MKVRSSSTRRTRQTSRNMAERRGIRLRPPMRREASQRRSFGQSSSTSIDISPIVGTPLSSDCDQNPFSDSPHLTPSQSFNSSAYSTESQRRRGRQKAQKQREELHTIRVQTQGVQEYLLERLQRIEVKQESGDPMGLDYYEQELERMKDSLCSEARDTTARQDVSRQLQEMQREIQEMRETLTTKQSELQRQELESMELKHVVKTLERTVLDLGGSLELSSTHLQASKPPSSQCVCSIC